MHDEKDNPYKRPRFKRLHWAKKAVVQEAQVDYLVEAVNGTLMLKLDDTAGNEIHLPIELVRGIIAETDREWGRM